MPRVRLLSDPFLLTTALTLQARVAGAAGETQLADASLREASEAADRTGHPLLRSWARSCGWHLALARGVEIDAPMPSPESYEPIQHEAAHGAVLSAIDRGHGEQARDVARRLLERSLQAGCLSHAVDWWLACAAALAATGQVEEATSALACAIEHARAQRLMGPFVESGARIASVVGRLPDPDRRFLESVVVAGPPRPAARAAAPVPSRRPEIGPLAEPLSARELEVLGLARQGRSNRALFVSTGTIKTHMHRLMTKIGAKNRVEAIRFAENHGLLSDG
jgi:ATP/maltotriose-dependent transcriptional regulator MalT